MNQTLTAEKLRTLLDYNSDTGVFMWRPREGDKWFNSRFAGKQAGTLTPSGYLFMCVNKQHHLAHRLAWLYYYGEWPQHHIDHLDRNPSNNAIANLADVPPAINNQNKTQRIGVSGAKGVHRQKDKWIASVEYKGKRLHFGTFTTIQEASEAYEAGMQNVEAIYEQRQHLTGRKNPHKRTSELTHYEVMSALRYNPETGQFFWKANNKEAGSVGSWGYRRIAVNGRRHPAHTLAIFYMTGEWPSGPVDHINRNRLDNRRSNLRVATYSENALNREISSSRGIRQNRNKSERWEAAITVKGERYHLGTFDTEQEARDAWMFFVQEKGLDTVIQR